MLRTQYDHGMTYTAIIQIVDMLKYISGGNNLDLSMETG